jgi:hypothetical protein
VRFVPYSYHKLRSRMVNYGKLRSVKNCGCAGHSMNTRPEPDGYETNAKDALQELCK